MAGDGAGLRRSARERDGLARELSSESSRSERSDGRCQARILKRRCEGGEATE